MITSVFIDMGPFLIVLLFSILLLSINFMKLDSIGESYYEFNDDYEGNNLMKGFKQTWDLSLGSASYKFQTLTGWIIYFFAELFLVVVMLNLVISVVSDSYERV